MKVYVTNYPFCRYDTAPLDRLKGAGVPVTVNPFGRKMTDQEILQSTAGHEILIVGTENLVPVIESNPDLKMIARLGIGLDSIPLKMCHEKGIVVSYTPDAVSDSAAEMTIGMILAVTRQIVRADREVRQGEWKRHFGKRIGESIVGIIGVGRIGSRVGRLLTRFRPRKILLNDIRDISVFIEELHVMGIDAEVVSKEELYRESDIVTLHLPLNRHTTHMICTESLELFKEGSVLVNMARGEIVCEKDLAAVLRHGRLAGAALDVFENEPYRGELTTFSNVVLTQHMGACSYDARVRMEQEAVDDVLRFLKNEPLHNPVPESERDNSKH